MTQTIGFNSTPSLDEQEPTRESLKDVLSDRPLVRLPNYVDSERCQRCEEKNDIRRRYDREHKRREETFYDGERVRLVCIYDPDPSECQGWVVNAVHHTQHPMKDKADVEALGVAQAHVTGVLEQTGWTYTQQALTDDDEPHEYHVEDRSVVRDVEVEWFSGIEDGEEHEPIREPDEHGMIRIMPTDPRPHWPESENDWRKELMQQHDDWNDDIPTVNLSETDPI